MEEELPSDDELAQAVSVWLLAFALRDAPIQSTTIHSHPSSSHLWIANRRYQPAMSSSLLRSSLLRATASSSRSQQTRLLSTTLPRWADAGSPAVLTSGPENKDPQLGDYPEVPFKSYQLRKHDKNWWDPQEKRNFGEPVSSLCQAEGSEAGGGAYKEEARAIANGRILSSCSFLPLSSMNKRTSFLSGLLTFTRLSNLLQPFSSWE